MAMSDLIDSARQRLQKALVQLEKIIEGCIDERTDMRAQLVELEATNHNLQSEVNMLLRLQEQLVTSRANQEPVLMPRANYSPATSKVPELEKTIPNNEASNNDSQDDISPVTLSIKEFKAIAQRNKCTQ